MAASLCCAAPRAPRALPGRPGRRSTRLMASGSASFGPERNTRHPEHAKAVDSWVDARHRARLSGFGALTKDFLASVGLCFLLSSSGQHSGVLDAGAADHILLGGCGLAFGAALWRAGAERSQLAAGAGAGAAALAAMPRGGGAPAARGTGLSWLGGALAGRSDWAEAQAVDAEMHALRISLLQKDATIMYLHKLLDQQERGGGDGGRK